MGREIKRVAMDFVWPLGEVWQGFLNPHYTHQRKCPFCDGCGYNEATKAIADDWYDFGRTGRRWCEDITQDEVQALVDRDRLWDFTRVPITGNEERHPNGWTKEHNGYVPTAAEVNVWSKRGMGHDAINRSICVEQRASRLGVWGRCEHCGGDGNVWRTEADHEAAEAWAPTEPPSGEGWQLWETVSEGSPISPPCETPEVLARWLVDNRETSMFAGHTTYENWLTFIRGPGWAPSAMGIGGVMMSGVDGMVALQADET